MKHPLSWLFFIVTLVAALPTARAALNHGLASFSNDSAVQILLNQAASGGNVMQKAIEQYYDTYGTLPEAHTLQQCFQSPSLLNCLDNQSDGSVVVTFSTKAATLLATTTPMLRVVLATDSQGRLSFGSTLCVTTIGNTSLLNPVKNFVASPTVTGSNFGTCYYVASSAVLNMNYSQLRAAIVSVNTNSDGSSSSSENASTATIG